MLTILSSIINRIGEDLYDHLMSREISLCWKIKFEFQKLWDKWLWARFGFAISSRTDCMFRILREVGEKRESIQITTCLPYFRTWRLVDLQSRVPTSYDKYYLHKAHNNHFKAINKQSCCSYQLTRKRDCWGSRLLMAKCLRQLCRLLTCPPNIRTNITLQLPILPFRTAISKPNKFLTLL